MNCIDGYWLDTLEQGPSQSIIVKQKNKNRFIIK